MENKILYEHQEAAAQAKKGLKISLTDFFSV
jgi:hypothetical protein